MWARLIHSRATLLVPHSTALGVCATCCAADADAAPRFRDPDAQLRERRAQEVKHGLVRRRLDRVDGVLVDEARHGRERVRRVAAAPHLWSTRTLWCRVSMGHVHFPLRLAAGDARAPGDGEADEKALFSPERAIARTVLFRS